MIAVRIAVVCVAAAMVCASIRLHRPEMATALSMAVGAAVLVTLGSTVSEISDGIRGFTGLVEWNREESGVIVRAAGITVLSELGVQLCMDAGESALAGRIRLAARIAVVGMAMPMLVSVTELLRGFSG